MSNQFLYGGNIFANGIRQHYLRYGGKGPAVILIPGITSPAITWGFVAEKGCRCTMMSTLSTFAVVASRRPAPVSTMVSMRWRMTRSPLPRAFN